LIEIEKLSAEEVAALICQKLGEAGIRVTLTGGACVGIWSDWQYVSHDLDFIEEGYVERSELCKVLCPLGYREEGRHFVHDKSP
jgi:hypothetical protein